MDRHPGGKEQTLAMLYAASVPEDGRALDMGAGAGESVEIMRKVGMDAAGIDLEPKSDLVEKGDFLNCPYPDESFDAVLSQNAFYESGNVEKAFMEAGRLLKKGGKLLLSDVCFEPWTEYIKKAGLRVVTTEDVTKLWQSYYIERLWRGEDVPDSFGEKCSYLAMICEKE